MEVRILGPLTVMCDGHPVDITGAKERGLLVLLALQAGRIVSSERLLEELWEGMPPGSGVTALRVVVSRLRKALGDAGGAVVTRSPGYMLDSASVEVDAKRFEALVAKGRSHLDDGLADQAAAVLRSAIALWYGERAAEAPGPLGRAEAARLDESRIGAVEARIGADLARGAHASLIGELEALTATHPLREGLWHARIVALYRCGRQADALRTFQQLRVTLAEELGLDPSVELRRLEEAVLAQDPALDHRTASPEGSDDGLPTGVVTFLLTDIVDSTALWDDAPAAMERALEQHDDIVQATVASHGGQLIKSKGEGDSSLSVFRRASSAAAAAAELQRRMTDATWPAGLTLQVRAAIHTGEAQERDGDYYGSAVIRAARLRGLARGGQVLVSSATYELVQDALPEDIKLRSVGRRELRGLRRDEHVFELVLPWQPSAASDWTSDADDRARGVPPALSSRLGSFFVGRDEPLARLVSHWSAADGGQRQAVFIGGEPGIGKTRLSAELARHVADRGGRVVFGRCEEGIEAPYQPFIEVLRSLYDSGPAAEPRIASQLARLVPELADRIGGLPEAPRSTPEAERFALFEAMAEALDERAIDRAMLVVLDDLQWATDSTVLMLRHLLAPTRASRLMIVATFRDTEVDQASALAALLADLPRTPGAERLSLTGLKLEAVRAYLAASGRPERAGASAALHARTGGNPFLLGATIERNDDDSRPPAEASQVIGRRVDVLSPPTRALLTAAAVAGERVELRVLQHLSELGGIDSMLDALDEAATAGLVRDEGGTFAFGHALIREAILDAIAPSRQARLHQRIGEAIEALPDATTRLDQLAHHFVAAAADGNNDKAAAYSLAASREALARLAPDEAVQHAERGLAILGAGDNNAELRFDLSLAGASADQPVLFGARADSPTHFDRPRKLVELARGLDDKTRFAAAVLRLGDVSFGWVGSTLVSNEIEALYTEALATLPVSEEGLRASLLARLAAHRARPDIFGWAAIPDAEHALALARASTDPVAIAEGLKALRRVLGGTPQLARRLELCNESVGQAEVSGLATKLLFALYDRFVTHLEMGARDLAELDAERLRESRAARVLMLTEVKLATIDGRFADARRYLEEFVEQGRVPPDDPAAATTPDAIRLVLARETGRLARSVEKFESAVREDAPAFIRVVLALALAEADETARAVAYIDELVSNNLQKLPRDGMYPPALCWLAEACALTGAVDAAATVQRELQAYAGMLPSLNLTTSVVGAVDRYLGILATMSKDHDAAVGHFAAALALEEALRAPPLVARTCYWFGRALFSTSPDRSADLISRSLQIADELGMTRLAADSRQLLSTTRS